MISRDLNDPPKMVHRSTNEHSTSGRGVDMKYKEFERVKLKSGKVGTIMDATGGTYVVDVGTELGKFSTEYVEEEEIEKLISE